MPASSRENASTLDLSRIEETSRAASRTASTRPSARSRSYFDDDVAEHEAVERHPPRDQLADRTVALLDAQVAGVEAGGLDGDVGLGDEVLVAGERAQRGLLAGCVAVEGEDHLAAELLVVVEEPTQHPGVVVAEGGAAGGHGGRHTREVAGHHVGVALDDHRLGGAGHVAPGQVDAVEHVALLVEGGLGSVEVLRLDLVVVEDPPCPEADRVAARVADRPQQPAAEPVVRRPALTDQPGGDGLLVAEALLAQVTQQRLAVARREARGRTARPPPGRTRARPGTGGR